jgi:UDPglucose--hexose-1-phosphate uridylyltransferase
MGGFGEHDVIVETPDHSLAMAMMPDSQVSDILGIYKTRYDQLSLDPRIAQVTIFKNHGTDAGTSLEHPHSQMIATPVISYQVRQRFQRPCSTSTISAAACSARSLRKNSKNKSALF